MTPSEAFAKAINELDPEKVKAIDLAIEALHEMISTSVIAADGVPLTVRELVIVQLLGRWTILLVDQVEKARAVQL